MKITIEVPDDFFNYRARNVTLNVFEFSTCSASTGCVKTQVMMKDAHGWETKVDYAMVTIDKLIVK